jgi:C4-dicarboxylate-specific signal transduction histidine kinase
LKSAKSVVPATAADPVAAVARFVAGFTHRLQSPLTGVKGYGELLSNEEDRARRSYWSQQMFGSLESVERMLDGMRRYQVPTELNCRTLALRELAVDAWELALVATPGAAAKDLQLKNQMTAGYTFVVDPFHFRNLLVNLFQNAMDASERGGVVRIARLAEPELLVIEDGGAGLQGLSADKMYEPFFTTRADRAGLGLTVAWQIAAEHGLTFDWQDLQPRGLRIRILRGT